MADGLIGAVGAVAVGAFLAIVIAVALSPLSPLGPVRPVYLICLPIGSCPAKNFCAIAWLTIATCLFRSSQANSIPLRIPVVPDDICRTLPGAMLTHSRSASSNSPS